MAQIERNCTTCASEDKAKADWPCIKCTPNIFNKWEQKPEKSVFDEDDY